jgi:hypothetical protein
MIETKFTRNHESLRGRNSLNSTIITIIFICSSHISWPPFSVHITYKKGTKSPHKEAQPTHCPEGAVGEAHYDFTNMEMLTNSF